MGERIEGHGGDLVAETLKPHGVDRLFTLSGGHIFPIYDGMHRRGMRIVDTRHEQAAAFAAEAHGKLARTAGVCALTAGPGVTNGMSAITSAFFNGSPMLVLGGRAPELRWGQGSLQEMDHVPLVRTVTKMAETVFDTAAMADRADAAFRTANAAHRGPVFLDFRLGFGSFGDAKVVHIADHPSVLAKHVELTAGIAMVKGSLSTPLDWLADAAPRERDDWIGELRRTETDKRAGFEAELHDDR